MKHALNLLYFNTLRIRCVQKAIVYWPICITLLWRGNGKVLLGQKMGVTLKCLLTISLRLGWKVLAKKLELHVNTECSENQCVDSTTWCFKNVLWNWKRLIHLLTIQTTLNPTSLGQAFGTNFWNLKQNRYLPSNIN